MRHTRAIACASLLGLVLFTSACSPSGSSTALQVYAADSIAGQIDYLSRGQDVAVRDSTRAAILEQATTGSDADVLVVADEIALKLATAKGRYQHAVPLASSELVLALPESSGGKSATSGLGGTVGFVQDAHSHGILDRLRVPSDRRKEYESTSDLIGAVGAGEVDAGIVDAITASQHSSTIRTVELPSELTTLVRLHYVALVRSKSDHKKDAEAYVDGLAGTDAVALLMAAGFRIP